MYNLPKVGKYLELLTHKVIELESCSNPYDVESLLVRIEKKFESFGFQNFVGNIISGKVLTLLAEVIGPQLQEPNF